MTIYYVANARMPNEKAHGIQIAKTCEAFVRAGVRLVLVVPARSTGDIQHFYKLSVPIEVRRLPALNFYGMGQFGFSVSSFVFALSAVFFLLVRRFRGEQFTIYTIDMDTFSYALLRLVGLPYVAEMHGIKAPHMLRAWFFRGAKHIFAINKPIQESLVHTFALPPGKVVIERNGVDIERFSSAPTKEEARRKLLIVDGKVALYVGRFYAWKDVSILAEAADLLREEGIRIGVVGGSDAEFSKVTGVSDIPANLLFFGTRDSHEIPLWLAAADALLVLGTQRNSDSYLHTSPMKAFEYMAAKRPIVASRTPALTDILTKEEALFYEPDQADSLAKAIAQAVAQKNTAMVDAAYHKAQYHSWDARAMRLISKLQ